MDNVVYKYAFETEIGEGLELMPLGVRRKLDIAGLKFPLETWQALRFEERCKLCEEEPDEMGAEAYAALARGLAKGRPGQLGVLTVWGGLRPWGGEEARARLAKRGEEIGRPVSPEAWAALGDEGRYILWKLSEAGRGPQKLLAAMEALL